MKLSQDALISDEKLTKYLLASRRRNDKSGWLAQAHMKYEMFTEVVLAQDIPDKGLKQGDVATVVEYHELPGREVGYSLEIWRINMRSATRQKRRFRGRRPA